MSKWFAVCTLVLCLIAPGLVAGCTKGAGGGAGGERKEATPDQKALGGDLLNKATGGSPGAEAKTGGAPTEKTEGSAEKTEKTE